MMRITQRPEGYTVVRDRDGAVMLMNPEREPIYFPTHEEVSKLCMSHGFYEVKEGNPSGIPGGTLCTLVIG